LARAPSANGRRVPNTLWRWSKPTLPEHFRLIRRIKSRTTGPLRIHPQLRSFTAPANRSASASRDGTQPLAVQPLGDLPAGRPQDGRTSQCQDAPSPVPRGSADRAASSICRTLPGQYARISARLIPGVAETPPILMSSKGFGTSATIRSRSPSRSSLTPHRALSSSLTKTVFSQRSFKRPSAGDSEGPTTPLSPAQRRIKGRAPTSSPPHVQDALRHPQDRQPLVRRRPSEPS
jgi:hypothetical protein